MRALTAWVPLEKLGKGNGKHGLDTRAGITRLHGVELLTSYNDAGLRWTYGRGRFGPSLFGSLGRWLRRSTCGC